MCLCDNGPSEVCIKCCLFLSAYLLSVNIHSSLTDLKIRWERLRLVHRGYDGASECIHTVHAPPVDDSWENWYQEQTNKKISKQWMLNLSVSYMVNTMRLFLDRFVFLEGFVQSYEACWEKISPISLEFIEYMNIHRNIKYGCVDSI